MGTRDWFVGAALAAATLIPAAASAATIVGNWVEVLATTSSADQGYHELGVVHVGGPAQTMADPMAAGPLNMSITPSQIVLSWTRSDVTLTEPIRSYEFVDLTHPYTSATTASYTPGVALSFFGGDVFVNITKVMQKRGDTFTVDLNTATAVPEPAPWAMMLVGLAALGTVVRTRRGPAAALA
jgi:hypothetical protein